MRTMTLWAVAAVLALLITSCGDPATLAGPALEPTDLAAAHGANPANNVYQLVEDPLDWHSANAAARQMVAPGCIRAHLATVTSQVEADIVTALVIAGDANAWIGGFQGGKSLDQNWHWITGERFTYTNWSGGEPNDTPFGVYIPGSEQHLEVLAFAGQNWNDAPGFEEKNFVVESTHCS